MRNLRNPLFTAALAAATASILALQPVHAAGSYPSQPIRMLLGYTPGGAADAVARSITPKLSELLGQPVVVEYKAGAGGSIAADTILRAAPDGYTLHLIDSGAMAILPNVRKVKYDPLKSFSLIGMAAQGGLALAINPSVPANTVPELVKLLKENPSQYNYATSGVGGGGHVAAELLKMETGTKMDHIAYRGGGPAMTDLVGGQIGIGMSTLAPAIPQIRAGKIKALGVTSLTRAAALPDVPTIAEQGYPGFEALNWYALVAPLDLPAPLAEKLGTALNAALADEGVQKMLADQGLEVTPGPPQRLVDQITTDLEKWKKVTTNANITLE